MIILLCVIAYFLIGALTVFGANLYLLRKYDDIDGNWYEYDANIVKGFSFICWPVAIIVFIVWQIFFATFNLAEKINDDIRESQEKAKREAAEREEAERQAAAKKAMDETKFERSDDTNWSAK